MLILLQGVWREAGDCISMLLTQALYCGNKLYLFSTPDPEISLILIKEADRRCWLNWQHFPVPFSKKQEEKNMLWSAESQ